MSNKIKKVINTKPFYFILGALIFGTIGVSAATYFPSNDVTYDNTESGLKSTNVQEAIDELYQKANSSTINSSKLKDLVVTTGSGLYEDEYEAGRYIYRGNYVDNYITFNNEEWRILSLEKDGTLKIVGTQSIGDTLQWGYNNSWTNSKVNTYLNGTYYNKLSTSAKKLIVAGNFNVGSTGYFTNLQNAVNDEKTSKWNGKIALLTFTEVVRTNIDSVCVNNPINAYSSYYVENCGYATWLNRVANRGWYVLGVGWLLTPFKDNNNEIWTLKSYSNNFTLEDVTDNYYYDVYPVLHLKANLQLSGYGSKTHPYVIL